MRMAARWLLVPMLVVGCDSASEASDKSKQAAAGAVEAGKKASADAVDASKKAVEQAGRDAVDASKKAATDNLKKIADDANKYWEDVPSSGELSDTTKAWLKEQAANGGRSIETVLAEGEQQAPTAVEVGTALASAVDSESGFEPIYVKVEDREEADAKIGDMPKTQVIDGLTVGLKHVDAWEGLTNKKERGYLILWREDDHLIGFVYRSRRDLDLEKVAQETPRFVALVRKSFDEVE